MKKDPEAGLSSSLRETRTRLGISQQRLADLAGVSRQTIGGIEGGLYAPSAVVALRLAKALGCRIEEIFWLDDDLPAVDAELAGQRPATSGGTRVAMAQVEGRWVAHPLAGDAAFRSEMAPADGLALETQEMEESVGKAPRRVRVRLLDEPENLALSVVIAGCAPTLSLWARSAERWRPGIRVQWVHANSTAALQSLARREVHAAGVHLYDAASGECNVPFARRAMSGRAFVLVNLGVWEEGLLVAPGNPRGINGIPDLEGLSIVNRDRGSGARLLLDEALAKERISPKTIAGYVREVRTHQDVAQVVASGEADAGVGIASVAAVYGLSFVALRQVRYDLALSEESMSHEPVRQLLETLHHRWVRSQLNVLGGYDTSETGAISSYAAVS